MAAKANDSDFLGQYRGADSDGRLDIMMDNFATFPKLIRKLEKKIQYKVKAEREYQRSHSRGELGVRVQSSKLSDTTAEEAIANVTLEEAFATGKVDKGLLKGIDNAAEYEADIRIINVMRMDFELLEEIIEDLERDDSRIIKKYLYECKFYREIAEEEDCSYDSIKRRIHRVKGEIREEILECLELNCREVG